MKILYYDRTLFEAGIYEEGVWQSRFVVDPADIVGGLYRMRICRPSPSLGGVILDGPGATPILLRSKDMLLSHRSGEVVLVEVIRPGYAGKMPLATERVSFSNPLFVLQRGAQGIKLSRKIDEEEKESLRMRVASLLEQIKWGVLQKEWGIKVRTEGASASDAALEASLLTLSCQAQEALRAVQFDPVPQKLGGRDLLGEWIRAQGEAFCMTNVRGFCERFQLRGEENEAFRLEEDARFAPQRRLWLNRVIENEAAQIVIDSAEAAHIIDVNQGPGSGALPAVQKNLHVNEAALPLLARAIMLQRLQGIVLIDVLRMDHKKGRNYGRRLEAALNERGVEARCLGFTHTGLLELAIRRK